tara:strand:- start:580 stop:1209 length:630 start_codon:yes stop_codon:yes gene_type:complete
MKLILENWREFVNKEPERLDEGVMGGLVIQKMMAKVDDLIQSNNLNEVDNIIPLLKNLSRETQHQIIKALDGVLYGEVPSVEFANCGAGEGTPYYDPAPTYEPQQSLRERPLRSPTRVATDVTSVRNLGRGSSTGADTGPTWKDCYNKGLVLKTGPDGKGYCGEEGEDQLGENIRAMVEKLKRLGRRAKEKIIKGLDGFVESELEGCSG